MGEKTEDLGRLAVTTGSVELTITRYLEEKRGENLPWAVYEARAYFGLTACVWEMARFADKPDAVAFLEDWLARAGGTDAQASQQRGALQNPHSIRRVEDRVRRGPARPTG